MKNEKVCPKCTSLEIIRIPGIIHSRGSGNNIRRGSFFNKNNFLVLITRYVCVNCGFTEEWIDEKADVEKIKKWVDQKKVKMKLDELETDNNNFTEIPPWEKEN